MTHDDVKMAKVVKDIIYKVVDSKTDISERTDLISSHILDSISFIKLVSEIENVFDIELNINDLNIDKFKTINLIVENISKYINKD